MRLGAEAELAGVQNLGQLPMLRDGLRTVLDGLVRGSCLGSGSGRNVEFYFFFVTL
jgi:hypothetical protein